MQDSVIIKKKSLKTPKNKEKREFTAQDFQYFDQIGSGKFGNIYKVIQKKSGKVLAIKIIAKSNVADEGNYRRLANQIQIHSRLKYPFICELYCYFTTEDAVYLVLQYCKNNSLYQKIKQNTYRSEAKIAQWMYQLLLSINFLSKRSVFHRDIKLQNILLDEHQNIKLTDFGCCIHSFRQRKTFCGTMQYISPQMLYQMYYNNKVDVYSAGIVLYELFYGYSPFHGENQEKVFKNIQKGQIIFNQNVRILPQNAKKLILAMLQRDKQKRISASQALQHEFFRYYLRQEDQQIQI